MNSDVLCDVQVPHLQTIQTIPANTASEKQKSIGKSASQQLHVIQDLFSEQCSSEAMPIAVKVVVKYKQHEDITLALKSNDWTIVNRALKATWYFNGSQEITDAVYFSEHLFPYIFRRVKTRVVNTFTRCIKNPLFAQAIFNALTTTHNVLTALPLLMICDEEFIYETIVEKKLILPIRIFKKIYYKNPELGVRLLKEYIGHYKMYSFCDRHCHENSKQNIIQEYKCILHTLAKNRSMEFTDIVQNLIKTEELCSEIGILSKKCANKFLKKAKNAVIKHPHLYMPILSSQLISTELLKMMFPGLMKFHCRDFFCTDKMLQYLKDFPADKKLKLLFETYKDLYQHQFLDKVENVTPALLTILPIEKRIKFAQEMINNNSLNNVKPYVTTWLCYFPIHHAISIFKYSMRYMKTSESRLDLILKMVYTCKVNKDEDELLNVLSYVVDGKYITGNNLMIANEAMDKILEVFEISSICK